MMMDRFWPYPCHWPCHPKPTVSSLKKMMSFPTVANCQGQTTFPWYLFMYGIHLLNRSLYWIVVTRFFSLRDPTSWKHDTKSILLVVMWVQWNNWVSNSWFKFTLASHKVCTVVGTFGMPYVHWEFIRWQLFPWLDLCLWLSWCAIQICLAHVSPLKKICSLWYCCQGQTTFPWCLFMYGIHLFNTSLYWIVVTRTFYTSWSYYLLKSWQNQSSSWLCRCNEITECPIHDLCSYWLSTRYA